MKVVNYFANYFVKVLSLHGEKLPDILHLLGESIIPVVLNKCSTAAPLGSVELAFTKASVVTE